MVWFILFRIKVLSWTCPSSLDFVPIITDGNFCHNYLYSDWHIATNITSSHHQINDRPCFSSKHMIPNDDWVSDFSNWKRFQNWAIWFIWSSIISRRKRHSVFQIRFLEKITRRFTLSTKFNFAWWSTFM